MTANFPTIAADKRYHPFLSCKTGRYEGVANLAKIAQKTMPIRGRRQRRVNSTDGNGAMANMGNLFAPKT